MFFRRTRSSPRPQNIDTLSPRERADLPHFHPLADELSDIRPHRFEPQLTATWPWSAGR